MLAAIPLILTALLLGNSHAASAHKVDDPAAAQQCPTWFHRAPQLGPGLPDAVVVDSVREVVVCHFYENPNVANGPGLPPNNKLASEKVIDQGDTAQSLGRSFNRLRPYPSKQKASLLCSSEFGGGFYLRFLYSDGRKASIEVVPSGCPRAVAGKNGSWLLLSSHLRVRLNKIAPLP